MSQVRNRTLEFLQARRNHRLGGGVGNGRASSSKKKDIEEESLVGNNIDLEEGKKNSMTIPPKWASDIDDVTKDIKKSNYNWNYWSRITRTIFYQ